ncbi:hypothetical protein [Streptomyces sp. CCM_MD2014]|uniref:hypothetical protein n=1 Tax=Streptomyces sp. CCM_MD2014 TaxID=1561022 RepID=UPI00052AB530|nr:hypothetical protein [Streptomyces sp. CCM_MD2014]AIV35622.1 hypothetical protein NI25_20720 [Streptomyces sp. CCM_MD2014]
MSVQVRVNPGALARLLRLRNGPVERRLREKTRKVAGIAAREAPGSMGDYVDWDVVESRRGLQGVITCDHPAVRFVLDGTPPHLIRPRRRTYLRFQVGGRVVYTKLVRHPGTDANNFLERALRAGR